MKLHAIQGDRERRLSAGMDGYVPARVTAAFGLARLLASVRFIYFCEHGSGTVLNWRRSSCNAEKPALYGRLGGVYSIATVVDDFINRIMVDLRLNANPLVDEAHHRVPPAGFKYLVTEMLCWATGGPQKYTGKSMADSHSHLKITSKEWDAFLDDFQQTLDKFKVPAEEQAELKAIVNSTRSDIVVGSALEATANS
jgi:hemoglobin